MLDGFRVQGFVRPVWSPVSHEYERRRGIERDERGKRGGYVKK